MKTRFLLLVPLLAVMAAAQSFPDCQFTFQASAAGSQSPATNNLFTTSGGPPGCAAWIFNYWTNASGATSVQIEGAADAFSGGVHGPTGAWTKLTVSSASGSGTNPATGTTSGNAVLCCDYYPWIRITVNTLTSSGAGTQITVRVYGWRNTSALGGGGGGGSGLNQLTQDVLAGPGTGSQPATVVGIDTVPLCNLFSPTSGQFLQYTTGGTPNPCYTAVSGAAPTGAAGGDLSGSYPNPTVTNLSNVSNGSLGNAGLAHSSTSVNGQSCGLGGTCTVTAAPSGSAGGDLSGSYPNPGVAQINGAAVPASAHLVATNTSKQLISANANLTGMPTFCADATGSTTDYACNLSPAITVYLTGSRYSFTAQAANTAGAGKPTINFNSVGAVQIVKVQGGITTALAANDIRAGQAVTVLYDGTNMQMQSQLGNAPATGGTIASTTNTLVGDGAGNAVAATGTGTNCVQVNGSSTPCGGSGSLFPWQPAAATPPVLSSWTQINGSGSATYANTTNGVLVNPVGTSSNVFNALMIATPAPGGTAFTLTTKVQYVCLIGGTLYVHAIDVSDGTLYESFGALQLNPYNFLVGKWNSPTSYNTNYTNASLGSGLDPNNLFWRVQYTGTGGNLIYSLSASGTTGTFITVETHSATAFLTTTPTTIGFASDPNGSSNCPVNLVYWNVTTP